VPRAGRSDRPARSRKESDAIETYDSSVRRGLAGNPLAWAAVAALGIGSFETVKGYWAGQWAPNDFGWSNAILGNLPWWLLWAALVPVIFRLVERWPLRQTELRSSLPLHLSFSLVLSAFHLTVCASIIWAATTRAFASLGGQIADLALGYLVTDVITYWGIVAAYSGYRWHAVLGETERERHALQLRAARAEAAAAQLESHMTEARLAALRMELNPHFLFNTLNSVSALARRGDADVAIALLARLSEFLRTALEENREHEVTLDEEIGLLEQYLAIACVRFDDRLSVSVEVDEGVRSTLVPTFILQPLVENALRHGLEAARGPVSLTVSAAAVARSLEIVVRDSGPGFPEESGTMVEGIGLSNTRSRLQALYGPEGALELRRPAGGGAEVRVSLPLNVEAPVRVSA